MTQGALPFYAPGTHTCDQGVPLCTHKKSKEKASRPHFERLHTSPVVAMQKPARTTHA
jgi:hypothetical protein